MQNVSTVIELVALIVMLLFTHTSDSLSLQCAHEHVGKPIGGTGK